MDKEKFNYPSLGIANVCYQEDKNKPYGRYEHQIVSFMGPLIRTLSKRHPDYTFVGRTASIRGDTASWYNFFIYKGREHLGSVYQGYNSGEQTFCIESPTTQTSSSRRRKSYTETKDVKKAAKLFSQHMVPALNAVKLDKAKSRTNSVLAEQKLGLERRVIQHRNHLWGRVMDIMVAEWDTFAPKLLAAGASSEIVSEFVETRENYGNSELMSAYATQNHGATLLIQDDGSYLVRINKPITYSGLRSHDQLTLVMRTNLGMLKICADNTVISGVGVRYDDCTFFVVTEEEEDQ